MARKTIQGRLIPPKKKRTRFLIDKNTGGLYNVVKDDTFTGERTRIKTFKTKAKAKAFVKRRKK